MGVAVGVAVSVAVSVTGGVRGGAGWRIATGDESTKWREAGRRCMARGPGW